jgi:hypothetical protein
MNGPCVSIIIPCFNAERYIGEAITSALGQTYPYKEIIVIDDGSTDGSPEVIRSFGTTIRREFGPNRGGCAARNRGIELAQGEWIQFLDADDVLAPEKLERQVAAASEHPDCTVYCDYELVNADDGQWVETHSADCRGIDPLAFVLRSMRLQTSAPLHRKDRLTAVGGFRTDLQGSQEFDLHLRLAAAGTRFEHLAESLYVVWRRADSVSSDFVRAVGEQLKFLPALAADLTERGELTDERRRAFAERMAQNGRGCLQRGGRTTGMAFLREARKLDPAAAARVYSRGTRVLSRILGPVWTETLVTWKRRRSAGDRRSVTASRERADAADG